MCRGMVKESAALGKAATKVSPPSAGGVSRGQNHTSVQLKYEPCSESSWMELNGRLRDSQPSLPQRLAGRLMNSKRSRAFPFFLPSLSWRLSDSHKRGNADAHGDMRGRVPSSPSGRGARPDKHDEAGAALPPTEKRFIVLPACAHVNICTHTRCDNSTGGMHSSQGQTGRESTGNEIQQRTLVWRV